MIRELNASIRALDEAEQLRRETETAVIGKKYASGFAALGSWASGGGASSKTEEHAAADAQAQQTGIHRDGVMWFLRQRLELCCRTQQDMMETRLKREVEKSRGLLAPPSSDFAEFPTPVHRPSQTSKFQTGDEGSASNQNQGLTDEQVQMFEEGNQDMMKYYEDTLDQVRYVAEGKVACKPQSSNYGLQESREVADRDRGAAVNAGGKPRNAVGKHRTDGNRLVLDDRERWGRQ